MGQWVTEKEVLVAEIENYFVDIFFSSLLDDGTIEEVLEGVVPKFSVEERVQLDKPFVEREVRDALLSMKPWGSGLMAFTRKFSKSII